MGTGHAFPRFAPEALVPQWDALGAQGWELVSVEPAVLGVNGDVLVANAGSDVMTRWTNQYMCFLTRRKQGF